MAIGHSELVGAKGPTVYLAATVAECWDVWIVESARIHVFNPTDYARMYRFVIGSLFKAEN